jgi:hypothetical protein
MRAASRTYPSGVHSFAGTFFGREELSLGNLLLATETGLGNGYRIKLLSFTECDCNRIEQLRNLLIVVYARNPLHKFGELEKPFGTPAGRCGYGDSGIALS